jgi:hypothetical protein
LTTCHTTFSVIPSPQTVPDRQAQRNNLPEAIRAAVNHSSRNRFTHSGTGTVRTWPALSDEINDCQTILAPLKMVKTEIGEFTSPKPATEQDGNHRSVALALEGFGIRRFS